MLIIFGAIKDRFKVKYDSYCIDNWVFQLHYRVTTTIFLLATILVTAREYIGEHIKCINDFKQDYKKAIESYCFFTSTFTVKQNKSIDFEKYGILNYVGHLGNELESSKEDIKHHTYYQWVPFVLFGQAIMFYLTHLLWKNIEGGRIKKLVSCISHSSFAIPEKEVKVGAVKVPPREKIVKEIYKIKEAFLELISTEKSWARLLIFCEILNALHVVLEFYITNKFLGNDFYYLGRNVVNSGYKTLDEVFPKVAKCIFHKYGQSGSIQKHDILCVMALNIVNEKIYVFLWFWFLILFGMSCLALVWRFISVHLYSKSTIFNRLAFGLILTERAYPRQIKKVAKNFKYSDWLFLKYLSKNMNPLTFKELFTEISEDVEGSKESKPLCMVRLPEPKSDAYKYD